ncbi:MAG: hypothetical protein ABIK89_03030 [Planctomycetota bacterium]
MWRPLMILLAGLAFGGCSLVPEISHQPTLHNPFPQLSKVAVVPFFNQSSEPTVDGRNFALAYFNELQLVPGFEVVPVDVVETVIAQHNLRLTSPTEVRRLAQILEVDAVVLGTVTDYSAYYPPRCGLRVEWYAGNPCFHPIPPGYGLPWGTPEEEHIPGDLVFEAEMALAKEQLKTQTPAYEPLAPPSGSSFGESAVEAASAELRNPADNADPIATTVTSGTTGATGLGFPADWPDPRGFISPPPTAHPPACQPTDAPVLEHTRTYNGHDSEFTEALASYYYFRDDARFGGWQSYLERSDDFIRFSCHMHIWEMLSARGGAGETRVVWRWPSFR